MIEKEKENGKECKRKGTGNEANEKKGKEKREKKGKRNKGKHNKKAMNRIVKKEERKEGRGN